MPVPLKDRPQVIGAAPQGSAGERSAALAVREMFDEIAQLGRAVGFVIIVKVVAVFRQAIALEKLPELRLLRGG